MILYDNTVDLMTCNVLAVWYSVLHRPQTQTLETETMITLVQYGHRIIINQNYSEKQ